MFLNQKIGFWYLNAAPIRQNLNRQALEVWLPDLALEIRGFEGQLVHRGFGIDDAQRYKLYFEKTSTVAFF